MSQIAQNVKNLCENGDKTPFSENVNTIKHDYQFLTINRFSLFSRVIQKRKCFSFYFIFVARFHKIKGTIKESK